MLNDNVHKSVFDILKDTSESISKFYHEKLKKAVNKLEALPELKDHQGFRSYCIMLAHMNPIATILALNVEKLMYSNDPSGGYEKLRENITQQTFEHLLQIVEFMQENKMISVQRMN